MPEQASREERRPPELVRVNLSEDTKRAYWIGCLGVTEDRLRQVVAEVGPVAKDVRYHLGKP